MSEKCLEQKQMANKQTNMKVIELYFFPIITTNALYTNYLSSNAAYYPWVDMY